MNSIPLPLPPVSAQSQESIALEVYSILAAAIANLTVTHLNISDNALGGKGLTAFKPALSAQQQNLRSLLVHNVGASADACSVLADCLPAPTNLSRLSLYNNMSGDAGAKSIALIVAASRELQHFRMASCRVEA